MRTPMPFALAMLVTACGFAAAQPPPAPGPTIPPVNPPLIAPPPPLPHAPPTLDQLLDQLEQVQAQKAELAKREEAIKQAIRKKLDEQDQRLKKFGLAAQPAKDQGRAEEAPMPKEKLPDRIGRIIIEGNTKTAEQTIFVLIDMEAGRVLQYPALEAARAKLEKAGFTNVSVELVPGTRCLYRKGEGYYQDVRVKVTEPQPPVVVPAIRG